MHICKYGLCCKCFIIWSLIHIIFSVTIPLHRSDFIRILHCTKLHSYKQIYFSLHCISKETMLEIINPMKAEVNTGTEDKVSTNISSFQLCFYIRTSTHSLKKSLYWEFWVRAAFSGIWKKYILIPIAFSHLWMFSVGGGGGKLWYTEGAILFTLH